MQHQAKEEIKKIIRENIPIKKLDKIIIPSDKNEQARLGFEFFSGDEFRYMGAMYDIAKKTIEGSKIIAWCINDKKETSIIESLDRYLQDDIGNMESNAKALIGNFFKILQLTSIFTNENINLIRDNGIFYIFSTANFFESIKPEPPFHPPRFTFSFL